MDTALFSNRCPSTLIQARCEIHNVLAGVVDLRLHWMPVQLAA